MSIRSQKLCAWCGVPMVVLWLLGFLVFAHFVPPPSPGDTAAQITHVFRSNTTGIRIGLVLTALASALLAPFIAEISVQLKRVEGRNTPLAFAQLALGATLSIAFIFPVVILEVATFRVTTSPAQLRTLDDVGWLLFISVVSPAVLELILIGAAILQDRRPAPIFPRWVGYFNIWVGLLLLPGVVTVFFKSGVLAWNGLLAWWVPAIAFASWLAVMTVSLLKAITRESEEAGDREPWTSEEMRDELERLKAVVAELSAGRSLSGASERQRHHAVGVDPGEE